MPGEPGLLATSVRSSLCEPRRLALRKGGQQRRRSSVANGERAVWSTRSAAAADRAANQSGNSRWRRRSPKRRPPTPPPHPHLTKSPLARLPLISRQPRDEAMGSEAAAPCEDECIRCSEDERYMPPRTLCSSAAELSPPELRGVSPEAPPPPPPSCSEASERYEERPKPRPPKMFPEEG